MHTTVRMLVEAAGPLQAKEFPEVECIVTLNQRIHTFRYTVMRRLTTGIHSEKCVVRRFRRANVTECTYTNLDTV